MEALGLDFRLVLIQAFNFLVFFWALKKWVFPAFLKFLDGRVKKIEESLNASERMRKEIKEFEAKKAEELQELRRRTQNLLDEARAEAGNERRKMIEAATEESRAIVKTGEAELEIERKKILRQAKNEVSELSLEIARKIIGQMDEKKARELIQAALTEDGGRVENVEKGSS